MTEQQLHPREDMAERIVIARIVNNGVERRIARDLLKQSDFVDEHRSTLFCQLSALEECDLAIARGVCRRLSEPSVGLETEARCDTVARELDECMAAAAAFDELAPIRAYAVQLRSASVVRRLAAAGVKIWRQAAAGTIESYEDLVRKFAKYAATQETKLLSASPSGPESISGLMEQMRTRIDAPKEHHAKRTVGASGLDSLTNAIGCFERGDVYAIIANPGAGKTAFVLQLAGDLAIESRTVFFSLEMPKEQLCNRLLASVTGIAGKAFKNGDLTEDQKKKAREAAVALSSLRMTVKDCPSLDVEDLIAAIRAEHAESPLDVVIIDYMQKLSSSRRFNNRDSELGYVSGALKALSMELGFCCIVVAAINREASKEGRAPTMRDMRECGKLEYDAHTILALHDKTAEPPKTRAVIGRGEVPVVAPRRFADRVERELHIVKQRDGEPGVVIPLWFFPAWTRFADQTIRMVR